MPKAIKLPVEKVCVLSTGHVTLEDSHLLNRFASVHNGSNDTKDRMHYPRIEKHEYGWLVFLSPASALHMDLVADLVAMGFSPFVIRIYNLAIAQGFSFINFDRDGEEVDGLSRFEW